MSEILLQTIVEKLESLEIALLKESDSGKDEVLQKQMLKDFNDFQSEVGKFTTQLNINNEKLNSLSKEINGVRINLSNSKVNHVKHTRNFYRHLLITVSLFIISSLLTYGWINCHDEKKVFEAMI